MTDLTGQIAQYIIPADGLLTPQGFWLDWARSRTFLYHEDPLTIRAYGLSLATQTLTASRDLGFPLTAADIDPVSGNIISWSTGGNYSPLLKLSGTTVATLSTFGTTGAFGSYPTGVFVPEHLVCVGVGTAASGGATQVGYAIVKQGVFSGDVEVYRTDVLAAAGFSAAVVSGSINNRSVMARGKSGASGGSAFLTWSGTEAATIPLYSVTISPGAETYDIGSWPTPNPHIASATLGTIAAAAVDATWTTMIGISLGYDAGYDHVTMIVQTNAAVTTQFYLLVLSPIDASILAKTPLTGVNVMPANLGQSRITHGNLPLLGRNASTIFGVQTLTGEPTINTVLGALVNLFGPLSSDDTAQLIVLNTNYTNGVDTPTPVSGTASSFDGFAIMSVWPPFPVAGAISVGNLWFGPTTSFVDLSLEANRRKYVTAVGATQDLYADGTAPFGTRPPVFLTRYTGAAPNTFAANAGSGGTFVITGGDLTSAASAPPCAFEGTGSPWASDAPIVWLRWSDDRGRTWSNPVPQGIGTTGSYLVQPSWSRLGLARDRIFEVYGTTPGRMAINGAWLDPEPIKCRS